VALSSDAHTTDQLAFRYDDALEFLDSVGVTELAVFDGRERRLEPIG
jgi:histidinol-phosphatase (PHP family)